MFINNYETLIFEVQVKQELPEKGAPFTRKVTRTTWKTSASLHILPGTPSAIIVHRVAKWLLHKYTLI